MKIIIEWINNIILSQWQLILAFFISQLINVILSTIKSVLTVKGTKFTATLINTISYTLNAAVINQIGKVDDLFLVCLFTAITNIIGVSFSLWLLDKLRKEQLWRISATVKTEFFNDLIHELSDNNIVYLTLYLLKIVFTISDSDLVFENTSIGTRFFHDVLYVINSILLSDNS